VSGLASLPPSFAETREGLRALACYAISPARKVRTGRIGLRSTGDGFGTPPFDGGSRIVVRGDRLVRDPDGGDVAISTVRAAADFLGIELSADPGVGHDLPPFTPDADLAVDEAASLALGAWYAYGAAVFDRLPEDVGLVPGEAQIWPEHFDFAVTLGLDKEHGVNVGFSPGDGFCSEPYLYVGPHAMAGLEGDYWNAPFGAYRPYNDLQATDDPVAAALAHIREGLGMLGAGLDAPT